MKMLWRIPICAPLCLGLATWAQNNAPPQKFTEPVEPDAAQRIILDVTRVNVLFTVTDKKGRFVTDLGKDDFQVIDNKKPQTIQQFTAESDLPLRLAVLMDT